MAKWRWWIAFNSLPFFLFLYAVCGMMLSACQHFKNNWFSLAQPSEVCREEDFVSAGREEHIDWYFIVRRRLMWNQMYRQLLSKRLEKKWHFKQLRHISIKAGFLTALFLRERRLMNKDAFGESFFFCLDGSLCAALPWQIFLSSE